MNKARSIPWISKVLGVKKVYILVLTIAESLYGGSGVLYALFMKDVVDAALSKNEELFKKHLLYICLLALGQILLRCFLRWLNELSKSSFENAFKGRLFDTLLRKDLLKINKTHTGEWINRLTNDTVVVSNACVDILPGLCSMIVKLFSALAMIIVLEYRFAYILLPAGFLSIAFTVVFRKIMKNHHKTVQESDGKLRIFFHEIISNMLIVRSFSAEKKAKDDAKAKMDAHKSSRMKRNAFSNFCNTIFATGMSGIYLLGIGWCGYGILKGTITFGTLTAITQLIAQIQSPFANISSYLPRFYSMQASAERLMEAESYDEYEGEVKELDEIINFYYQELESIKLKDVSFSYSLDTDNDLSDEASVNIENISLEIKKGDCIAFTGKSGCGKSTVLKLLMCVYDPVSGERLYTDKEGKDNILDSSYRRLFAYVPQGHDLMNGSIREAISFARPEASSDDEKLSSALRIACADEFVNELENGIDTELGERGSGLSEGQMQRIAIARAIFSGSPVLLLDESTSALDQDTEKRLLDNLKTLTDKTIVIVTHRDAALGICNKVYEFSESGVRIK